MKKFLLLLFLSAAAFGLRAQSLYFPPNSGNTWDTISPASLGWCPDKVDELLDYLDSRNTKAFILLKDGKIVLEEYFGTFTQDSIWYWASAGKTITAFMVGIAQQEGHLSISDTTSDYLGTGWTSCTSTQEEKITIRHQLTMTTGLDDGVPDPYCTTPSCLQYLADPGTRWAYHNGPYTMLDGVIQAATGQSLNIYTAQRLMQPTGMAGAFVSSGYNNVFFSKPRTMARFGLLMLNGGNWNGNQIMTDATYYHDMINTSQSLNLSYGYLWWLNGKASYHVPGLQLTFPGSLNPHAPSDMFAAMGKNGQFINVVPSMNLVYIRMGNAPDGNDVPFTMNDTIWQKLNDLMCNTAVEEPVNSGQPLLYPNPAEDFATIELPGKDFSVILSDISGRIMQQQISANSRAMVNCMHNKPGIYIVQIVTTDGKIYRRKLILKQ